MFARDIPGVLIQYAKNISIDHFKLTWTNTRMPFFTHGIEAVNFNGLTITHFSGTASPVNKKAARIYLDTVSGFTTDNKAGVTIAEKKIASVTSKITR